VAVFLNPNNPSQGPQLQEVERVAGALGLRLLVLEVRTAEEFAGAFEGAARAHAEGLIPLSDPLATNHRARIAQLAADTRLPAVYDQRDFVVVGGLMAYGTNFPAHYRRAAYYVDRILKGAKPGELPIEQPMIVDCVINLKAAAALGLTIPPAVLAQATEIVQ
jgi:putative ABC transport system substrate-binding protein